MVVLVVSWYMYVYVLVLAVAAVSDQSINSTRHTAVDVTKSNGCGRVWVTVNTLELTTPHGPLWNAIELNWDYTRCFPKPQLIGLFDAKPKTWSKALNVFLCNSSKGYAITNETLGRIPITHTLNVNTGLRGPHCIWPWVGAGDDTIIFAYNCLKIQPTWMEDNIDVIGGVPIGELVIPGTHNSGAWEFYSEISLQERDSFALTQDHSVWAQLIHGIRFFDIRVGYYDFFEVESERFWVNHNQIRIRALKPILKRINVFLSSSVEVVFLNIHQLSTGFYGPDGSRVVDAHAALVTLIKEELGDHLADAKEFITEPGTRGPPLNTFIKADRRVLVSFIDSHTISEHDWLWPPVPQMSINTNDPAKVLSYLDKALTSTIPPYSKSPLHVAMAQATPTIEDILYFVSLRECADIISKNITNLLETKWRRRANIVATDFFLSNDVVDVSIMLSIERSVY